MADTDAIKKSLRKKQAPPTKQGSLSTGSALLNLALTGKVNEGWDLGCFYLLVGSSSSGKTFLTLQALAEASIDKRFEDYRLVYDAPERGARMRIEKFFGRRLADRLEWKHSRTVQEFYFTLDDYYKAGKPFVYCLDSESSLSSDSEASKFQEAKTAWKKDRKNPGSYGDGKAKVHSSGLRDTVNKIAESGSVVLMVAQTRDNIGIDAAYNPETRSGGRALTFYGTAEIWLNEKSEVRKRVRGQDEKIGAIIRVRVKKNRDTGREPTFFLRHYLSHGFDDTESLIDFLLARDGNRWAEKDGVLVAPDFKFRGDREDFLKMVREKKLGTDLRMLAASVWEEIDQALVVDREKRYE